MPMSTSLSTLEWLLIVLFEDENQKLAGLRRATDHKTHGCDRITVFDVITVVSLNVPSTALSWLLVTLQE